MHAESMQDYDFDADADESIHTHLTGSHNNPCFDGSTVMSMLVSKHT